MRKVLLAIVVVILAAIVGMVVMTMMKDGDNRDIRQADVPKDKEFELKIDMPVGEQVNYDVEIERLQKISSNEGQVIFGVRVDMVQGILNYDQREKDFDQFHMDLFKDIKITKALRGNNPLEADLRNQQFSEDERRFKYGAYIFNNNKMLTNGLPATLPEIKKESDIANAQLNFIQYFPGKKYKVGDKWDFSRTIGDYTIDYKFSFENIVYVNNYLCGEIHGVVTCKAETKDLVYQPTTFTIWLGLEERIVVASDITQNYKVKSNGIWVAITMHMKKCISELSTISPELLTYIKSNAVNLTQSEKDLRQKDRDPAKAKAALAFYNECKPFFANNLFEGGVDFVISTQNN